MKHYYSKALANPNMCLRGPCHAMPCHAMHYMSATLQSIFDKSDKKSYCSTFQMTTWHCFITCSQLSYHLNIPYPAVTVAVAPTVCQLCIYKYNKQLTKIEGWSRDDGVKKYANKICRRNNHTIHPYAWIFRVQGACFIHWHVDIQY